ncbi:MAG: IPT/TIG domain-containing protein [Planctomycetota bacterium]|jgi:hypothetical protein
MQANAERAFLLMVVCPLLFVSCGGGGTSPGNTVTGVLILGPASDADIAAYALFELGAIGLRPLGTTRTASDGSFTVGMGDYTGPVVLFATGGSYTDEATGASRIMPDDIPVASLAMAVVGQTTSNITPLTHWAAVVTRVLAADPDSPLDLATDNATKMVERYFGVRNIFTLIPADLTVGPVAAGPAAEQGAALSGLSQLADDLGVEPVELLSDLAFDGTDGIFDALRRGTALSHPRDSGGTRLRDAVVRFLDQNSRNVSGLTSGDVGVDEAIDAHIDTSGSSPDPSSYRWPPRVSFMTRSGGPQAGGTTFTLNGAEFDTGPGVEVHLGQTAAAIASSSPTMVTASTAASITPGFVDIEIRNLETDLVSRLERGWEFVSPLAPNISRLCPTFGPIAGGTLIEVHGNFFDETSEVRLDGTAIPIARAEFPHLLVAVAPAHAAALSQVRVHNGAAPSNPANFVYRERDVGQELDDGDVEGDWKVYSVSHDFTGGSHFAAMRVDVAADDAGGISFGLAGRLASASDIFGSAVTDTGLWEYVMLPDGVIWVDQTPGETDEDLRRFVRAWMQDEADVFVGGVVERDSDTSAFVGIREASGMRNSDLFGTYWVSGVTHTYEDGTGARTFRTFFGPAQFDGQGAGSVAFLVTERESGEPGYGRALQALPFNYAVAANGTFTLSIELEDRPVPFQGSLTQQADFAAGVLLGDEGELGMLVMTERGHGRVPSAAEGSWYGGTLAMSLSGAQNLEHGYVSGRNRLLTDVAGVTLFENLMRQTSDTDTDGDPEEGVDAFRLVVDPAGRIRGRDDPLEVLGALGDSQRFFVIAPQFPFGDEDEQTEQLFGLVLRNCAHYSKAGLEQEFNFVSMSQQYMSPADPPSPSEELHNIRGRMDFSPAQTVSIDGMLFLKSGTVDTPGGTRHTVMRDSNGFRVAPDPTQGPAMAGGYAVAGDGRLYVFDLEPLSNGTARLAQNSSLDALLGQVTPHGEAAVLRDPVAEGHPNSCTVLARRTTTAPRVLGEYLSGGVGLGFDSPPTPAMGYGEVTRELVTFTGAGTLTLDTEWFRSNEDGTTSTGNASGLPGTFSVSTEGTISIDYTGIARSDGIVTPDGSAIFAVNLDPSQPWITWSVYVLKTASPGSANAVGSFAMGGLEQEYDDSSSFPPAARARTRLTEGVVRSGSTEADVGSTGGTFRNTEADPDADGIMEIGMGLTVDPDGSMSVTAAMGVLKGGVSADGRYAFLIPGDPPAAVHDLLLFRR